MAAKLPEAEGSVDAKIDRGSHPSASIRSFGARRDERVAHPLQGKGLCSFLKRSLMLHFVYSQQLFGDNYCISDRDLYRLSSLNEAVVADHGD